MNVALIIKEKLKEKGWNVRAVYFPQTLHLGIMPPVKSVLHKFGIVTLLGGGPNILPPEYPVSVLFQWNKDTLASEIVIFEEAN